MGLRWMQEGNGKSESNYDPSFFSSRTAFVSRVIKLADCLQLGR